jgi:hypothetical protein
MQSRLVTAAVTLAAIGAVSVPAIAQARHGSDDPAGHVRREHRHIVTNDRHRDDRNRDRDRGDDHGRHDGRGSDDGPNHR